MAEYKRTVEELKDNAVFFWPKDLIDKEASISVIAVPDRVEYGKSLAA